MNAAVLNPRAATVAAIAHAAMPYDLHAELRAPRPEDIRDIARSRFGLDVTDAEVRVAVEAAMTR